VNIDPDRRMRFAKIVRKLGVRHQMKPHQLHRRDLSGCDQRFAISGS
jgi:hypothetical protein